MVQCSKKVGERQRSDKHWSHDVDGVKASIECCSGTEEMLDELRFLVTRIHGPHKSDSDSSSYHSSRVRGEDEDSPKNNSVIFKLSDLQMMLHARPDARMERWVQNLQAGLGPGDHGFTAELLYKLLQTDCFEQRGSMEPCPSPSST